MFPVVGQLQEGGFILQTSPGQAFFADRFLDLSWGLTQLRLAADRQTTSTALRVVERLQDELGLSDVQFSAHASFDEVVRQIHKLVELIARRFGDGSAVIFEGALSVDYLCIWPGSLKPCTRLKKLRKVPEMWQKRVGPDSEFLRHWNYVMDLLEAWGQPTETEGCLQRLRQLLTDKAKSAVGT